MTPNELYQREPERVILPFEVARDHMTDYFAGVYYNHLQEIDVDLYRICSVDASDEVEIKVYKDFDFDGRRFWRLSSAWFRGKPVMIMQNAGREGDDYVGRFITDYPLFNTMVIHIEGLIRLKICREAAIKDVVNPDNQVPNLDDFYGNSLDGYFTRYFY